MAMPFLGDDADWSNPSEVCLELLVERGPSLAPDRPERGLVGAARLPEYRT
jgi:hypothetical protein